MKQMVRYDYSHFITLKGYADASIMMHIRNLENQVRSLQSELATLKRKMNVFEEDTNRNRWGIRYSRRMAIMSNVFLGLWYLLISHLTHHTGSFGAKL